MESNYQIEIEALQRENIERDRKIQRLESNTEIIIRMDERVKNVENNIRDILRKLDDSVITRKEYDQYIEANDRRVARLEKAIIGFAVFIIVAVGTAIINGVLPI